MERRKAPSAIQTEYKGYLSVQGSKHAGQYSLMPVVSTMSMNRKDLTLVVDFCIYQTSYFTELRAEMVETFM